MLFFVPSAVLFLLGYLIRYKQLTWLISGYNTASREAREKFDKEKLTRHVGNFMFLLGGISLLMAVAGLLFPAHGEGVLGFGIGALTLAILGGLYYLNTGNRVMKD